MLILVRISRLRPVWLGLPKGRLDQGYMKVRRFDLDALAQTFVQGIVSKSALNASQVDIVPFRRQCDCVRISRAGQLNEEAVGIAVRCPRDNVGRERASIHRESDSCHASPNASPAALMMRPLALRRKFESEP